MVEKSHPTPDQLHQLLRYEPETGRLFWLARPREMFGTQRGFATWNARYAGSEAFTNTIADGYRTGTIHNKSYRAHRVIWAIVTGEWPQEVDHENGVRSDNRWSNLRASNPVSNKRNCRRYSNNSSGHTGVYWVAARQRWVAMLQDQNGRSKRVGSFKSKEAAAAARKAADKGYGYSTRHGEG